MNEYEKRKWLMGAMISPHRPCPSDEGWGVKIFCHFFTSSAFIDLYFAVPIHRFSQRIGIKFFLQHFSSSGMYNLDLSTVDLVNKSVVIDVSVLEGFQAPLFDVEFQPTYFLCRFTTEQKYLKHLDLICWQCNTRSTVVALISIKIPKNMLSVSNNVT